MLLVAQVNVPVLGDATLRFSEVDTSTAGGGDIHLSGVERYTSMIVFLTTDSDRNSLRSRSSIL